MEETRVTILNTRILSSPANSFSVIILFLVIGFAIKNSVDQDHRLVHQELQVSVHEAVPVQYRPFSDFHRKGRRFSC